MTRIQFYCVAAVIIMLLCFLQAAASFLNLVNP